MSNIKKYRFYFLPDKNAKRLYVKTIDGDITLKTFEAEIFKTNSPKDKAGVIRSRLVRRFDSDIEYSKLPMWNNLEVRYIPIQCEIIPKDELEEMKSIRRRKALRV